MKNNKHTIEKKAANKNGIKRLIFVGIAIIIEIIFWYLMLNRLKKYATWIEILMSIFAIILVILLFAENKTAAIKIPWIMLILAFPVFGLLMFVLIGLNPYTKAMKKRYQKIDEIIIPLLDKNDEILEEFSCKDPHAASISKYIYNNTSYPVYDDTKITYFNSAEKAYDDLLKELSLAKKYIFMEYHAIEDLESWKRIEEILLRKVSEGIEVRVFYDDLGSISFVNYSFAKKLREKGINCRVFNPFLPGINMFLNNRDHRKITIIDGKTSFTGGYNIANEYFNITSPYGKWKDTGIKLEGSATKSFVIAFLSMWNAIKDNDIDDTDFQKYLTCDNCENKVKYGYISPYVDSPLDDIHTGEDVYINILNKATKYCYFITPYFILSDELIHAFNNCAMRGVDVRIITPGIPDKKIVYRITRSFYSSVIKSGVKIYEWTPGFCHAKMCISDDIMATCGTINLDYRSLYHHFENGCYFNDEKVIKEIKDDFDNTFKESREVTNDYLFGDKAKPSLLSMVLRIFSGML